jgi:hypothetical protein
LTRSERMGDKNTVGRLVEPLLPPGFCTVTTGRAAA